MKKINIDQMKPLKDYLRSMILSFNNTYNDSNNDQK